MRFLITNYNNNYSTRAANNNIFVLMPNCDIYKTSIRYITLWNSYGMPENPKLCENTAEFKCVYKEYLCACYIFYSLLFCLFVYLSGPNCKTVL